MKSTHIAFFSFPHTSHLNATLPIISVLVRRGYRITYVTSEKFKSRVESLGAEVVLCPPFDIKRFWEETSTPPAPNEHPFCRLALRTLAAVTPYYEQNRPDFIMYDLVAFAGRILAHRWGIPAIKTSPAFAFDRRTFSEQVPDPEYRQHLFQSSANADEFLSHHGIPDSDFLFHREALTINLFPRAFQPRGDMFGSNCFYAGRCAAEQTYYGDWKKTEAHDRPIALVATSTSYLRGPDYFKMCIEGLADLDYHVLLSIGDLGDPRLLDPLPPHFEIVQHTSHVKLLPHVGLFISQGGLITSSEAAYHGIPLIATSLGFPELEWLSDNIARLGLGVHLRKDSTSAQTLREAAIHVSRDTGILSRVREMQRNVREEPGAEQTANRIEDHIGM